MDNALVVRSSMVIIFAILFSPVSGQEKDTLISFFAGDSVRVTVDRPLFLSRQKPVIITFYALPNGNSTEQTLGKKLLPGDDWHYDIQHIRAQTRFIRRELPAFAFIVILLENNLKSWPAWKQRYPTFRDRIPALVDSLTASMPGRKKSVYLNGHSGGGSFIFGYLAGVAKIPRHIKRISFLDSDYGYDSSYYPKLRDWLKLVKGAALNVFAYNDSVALYNGKPVVSATGGTWYRSRLWLHDMQTDFTFENTRNDSLIFYRARRYNIGFYFKTNPERKILHTTQVELNGFIHSVLAGTARDSKHYEYYGKRAYANLIGREF